MITTSVKDVNAQVMSLAQGASSRTQTGGTADSFQNVLDRQTQDDAGAVRSDRGPGSSSSCKETDRSDRIRSERRDAVKTGRKGLQPEETGREEDLQAGGDAAGEAAIQNALETAMVSAVQLTEQLAQTLGMTIGEVEGLMQDLGISNWEILSPRQLGEVFLEASKAEDSFELVTDGELYEKLQSLLEAQSRLAKEAADLAHMEPENMLQKLSEAYGEPISGMEAFRDKGLLANAEDMDDQEGMLTGKEVNPEEAGLFRVSESGETQAPQEGMSRDRKGDEEPPEGTGREQGSANPVLQQTFEDGLRSRDVAGNQGTAALMDPDTQDLMRQIMDYMKIQVRPGVSSLEMQLHPASLGSLQIQLSSRGGVVTAQFIAQNEAVKAALETQMVQLRESFEEQGIRVEAIEVSVQTNGLKQEADEQGRGQRRDQAPGGARRARTESRLTLQTEALTQEEGLLKEVMSANGGTVDYTV